MVISLLFYQGTMPLGKREIVQPIPITLRHVQSRGIALHTPEDRLGRGVILMPTIAEFCPNFAPTCVTVGLTLRLTRTAYQQREVTNEVRCDELLLV
jgi:hypothetical protein